MATYKCKRPYMYGTGRRKQSVARVHLIPNGTGAITINQQRIIDRIADILVILVEALAQRYDIAVVIGDRFHAGCIIAGHAVDNRLCLCYIIFKVGM